MASEKPIYTLQTSVGNKDFTTESPHTEHSSVEAFLKSHENFIKTLTAGAIIYNVIVTHHGQSLKLT